MRTETWCAHCVMCASVLRMRGALEIFKVLNQGRALPTRHAQCASSRGVREHCSRFDVSLRAQVSGDGCSASCECEQNPCAFSVGASVQIDSVISRLRGGSSLTLLAGTFGCGWSVWSANGEDQRPITIRGQGPSDTIVDCDHAVPVRVHRAL